MVHNQELASCAPWHPQRAIQRPRSSPQSAGIGRTLQAACRPGRKPHVRGVRGFAGAWKIPQHGSLPLPLHLNALDRLRQLAGNSLHKSQARKRAPEHAAATRMPAAVLLHGVGVGAGVFATPHLKTLGFVWRAA